MFLSKRKIQAWLGNLKKSDPSSIGRAGSLLFDGERNSGWLVFLTVVVLVGTPVESWLLGDRPAYGQSEGSSGVVQVSVGSGHNCAVLIDGSAKCWGVGSKGRLGNGDTVDQPMPVFVSGLNTAIQIAVGNEHSCAVLADGSVQCWGEGWGGRLGNGSNSDQWSPVFVVGISNAVEVSAGLNSTCALLDDGRVHCWGFGTFGQLGNGDTSNHATPVEVVGINSAVELSVGLNHGCVLLEDGRVQCWGRGVGGQLGNGDTGDQWTPVEVVGISSAVSIGVGDFHSCAVLSDGRAQCWGTESYGALGNGDTGFGVVHDTPVDVVNMSTARSITGGSRHGCVVLGDGRVQCWGHGGNGRLGDGTTTNSGSPVDVVGISDALEVSAGSSQSCAVLGENSVKCWGSVPFGEDQLTPVVVEGLEGGGSQPDTTPPSVPQNLQVDSLTSAQVSLSWEASSDNVGVSGYKVFRDGIEIGTSVTTSFTDTTVSAGVTYSYSVLAFDGAGNESGQSTALQVTTATATLILDTGEPFENSEGWVLSASHISGSDGFAVKFNVPDLGAATSLTGMGAWFSSALGEPGTGTITAVLYADDAMTDIPGTELFAQSGTVSSSGLTIIELGSWLVIPGTYWAAFEVRAGDTFSGGIVGDSAGDGDSNPAFSPQPDEAFLLAPIYGELDTLNLGFQVQGIRILDTVAPSVPQNLQVDSLTSAQVNLSWEASSDNVGVTGYKVFRDGIEIGTSVTTSFTDTTVSSGVTYSYSVLAFDGAGNESTQSASVQVNTPVPSDTTPPSVPQNLQVDSFTSAQVSLSWDASSDNVGVTGYKVFRGGTEIGTSVTTSFTDTTVSSGVTYSYSVLAFDGAGNESTQSASVQVNTPVPPDTTPPSVPQNLQVDSLTSVQVSLSWEASSDNVGVTGYKVFRDGIEIGTSVTTSFTDTTVSAGVTYSYTVMAFDGAGNESGQSSPVNANVPPDTTGPTIPQNLRVDSLGRRQVSLSWDASSDDVGVAGYKVFRDGVEVATTVTNSYGDSGLMESTLYTYTVLAFDGAGNESGQSTAVQATTTAETILNFEYDELNRLIEVTGEGYCEPLGQQVYEYDEVGNIIEKGCSAN